MLQISQPFSFPGPTRMSHRKRNLGGLSALGQKAGSLGIEPDRGRGIGFVLGVTAFTSPLPTRRVWTFRSGLVLS